MLVCDAFLHPVQWRTACRTIKRSRVWLQPFAPGGRGGGGGTPGGRLPSPSFPGTFAFTPPKMFSACMTAVCFAMGPYIRSILVSQGRFQNVYCTRHKHPLVLKDELIRISWPKISAFPLKYIYGRKSITPLAIVTISHKCLIGSKISNWYHFGQMLKYATAGLEP